MKHQRYIPVAEARQNLRLIVENVQFQNETYIITRHDQPAVAIVPLHVHEDYQRRRRPVIHHVKSIQEREKLSPEEAQELLRETRRK